MLAFIDSSILLRKLFGEPKPLVEWPKITAAWAAGLIKVELGRVIDRCRLAGQISDKDVEHLQLESRRVLRSIEILAMTEGILSRAAGPMPTIVGSLDAIHLATALELSTKLNEPLFFATHDAQLARAARASGLEVVGA